MFKSMHDVFFFALAVMCKLTDSCRVLGIAHPVCIFCSKNTKSSKRQILTFPGVALTAFFQIKNRHGKQLSKAQKPAILQRTLKAYLLKNIQNRR